MPSLMTAGQNGPAALPQIVAHVGQQDKSGVRYGGGDRASTPGSHELISLAVQHQGGDMQTGELAYDLEAAMWVPRSATADWAADDCIGISVLDCLQCDRTGTVRLDPGRGNRPTRSGR